MSRLRSSPKSTEVHLDKVQVPDLRLQVDDTLLIEGKQMKVFYSSHGTFVCSDRKKGAVPDIGFIGVVPTHAQGSR
jgi:hypothetical protein